MRNPIPTTLSPTAWIVLFLAATLPISSHANGVPHLSRVAEHAAPEELALSVTPTQGQHTALANSQSQVSFSIYNASGNQRELLVFCGTFGAVSGCNTSVGPEVLIGPWANAQVIVTFQAGSSGSGSVWLDAHAVDGYAQGAYAVTIPSTDPSAPEVTAGPSVTIPAGQTGSASFTITNSGGGGGTYNYSASCSGEVSCSTSGSVPINAYSSQQINVSFSGSSSGGNGAVTLSANNAFGSAQASVNVWVEPPPQPAPIQALGGDTNVLVGQAGTVSFRVLPVPDVSGPYSLSLACSAVSCSGPSPSTGPGDIAVPFTAGSTAGQGYVHLFVVTPQGGMSDLRQDITIGAAQAGAPVVTPKGDTAYALIGEHVTDFTVENTGPGSGIFNFSCDTDGTRVVGCMVMPSSPIGGYAFIYPDVSFTTAGSSSAGWVSLTASGTNGSDTGWYNVPAYDEPHSPPDVEPVASPVQLNVGTGQTVSFQVTNLGSSGRTYQYQCTVDGTRVSGCTVLNPPSHGGGQTKTVSVSVTSHNVPIRGWVQLRAVETQHGTADSATVTILSRHGDPILSPQESDIVRLPGSSNSIEWVGLYNPGDAAGPYTLGCTSDNSLILCAFNGSVSVQEGITSQLVGEIWDTGQQTEGVVRFIAARDPAGSKTDTATYNVRVGGPAPDITPDDHADAVTAGDTVSRDFTLTNVGTPGTIFVRCGDDSQNIAHCAVNQSSYNLSNGQSAPVTVSFSAGAPPTARLVVAASLVSEGPVVETGSLNLTVNPPALPSAIGKPYVDTSPTQWRRLDRSACLTVGAGPAASQCGDLVTSHSMPVYRQNGRAHTLTLIYNSGTAHPRPHVMADVWVDQNTLPPDSIRAELKVETIPAAGGDPVVKWQTAALYAGGIGTSTRRISIPVDAIDLETGIYAYELSLTNIYGPQANCDSCATTVIDTMVVVNRGKNRPLGAGWSVAGVDAIVTPPGLTARLLVHADGGYTVYDQVGTNKWKAAAGAFPDSITYESVSASGITGSFYVRRLPDRSTVYFDYDGRQLWVLDRVGEKVQFLYSGLEPDARLTEIRIKPYAANRTYRFAYAGCPDSCRLNWVYEPGSSSVRRRLGAVVSSGVLTRLQDPGTTSSQRIFIEYQGNLIETIRTQRGPATTTTFAYVPGTSLLSSATLPAAPVAGGGTLSGVIGYTPVQAYGLPSAGVANTALQSDVRFMLDGPRTDIADVSEIWLTHRLQPALIRDPQGRETTITYDAAYPLNVATVLRPNGAFTELRYDARGRLESESHSSSDSTAMSTYGINDALADGAGRATTHYEYDDKWNTVSKVLPAMRNSTNMVYDPVTGNRMQVVDAIGNTTTFTYKAGTDWVETICEPGCGTTPVRFFYDALGRPDSMRDARANVWKYRNDPYGNVRELENPRGLITETFYDLMNRDTLMRYSVAPGALIELSNPNPVRKTYAPDGLLLKLKMGGDSTEWRYNAPGWLVARQDALGQTDSTAYDVAGNAVATVNRRDFLTTHTFDALNRLTSSVLPTVSDSSMFMVADTMSLDGGPPIVTHRLFTVPGGLATYDYDVMGNMILARDNDSEVTREYNIDGTLKWEQQNVTGQSFLFQFTYDRAGRRRTVTYPTGIQMSSVPGYTDGVAHYAYGTPNTPDPRGLLRQITDPLGRTYTYEYDGRGRLDRIVYPNSMWSQFGYESDNAVRSIVHAGAVSLLAADTLVRDSVGNVRQRVRVHWSGMQRGSSYDYDGLNQMKATTTHLKIGTRTQTFGYNSFGDRTSELVTYTDGVGDPESRTFTYDTGRRLKEITSGGDVVQQTFNDDGSTRYREGTTWRLQDNGVFTADASSYRHLYDSQGRMVRYEIGGTSGHVATNQYDALGRRIRELDGSVERRFLYIGDELAVVLRKQGSQAEQGYLYVAEPGGLTPIGRIRSTTGIPHEAFYHRDEQGSVVVVSTLNGLQPAAQQNIEAGNPATAGSSTEFAEEAVGAYLGQPHMSDQGGGLVYMRNRFYDPNIGRFTQEDPIGFAGGLNLYAYAGNNPATYTDPFGLTPCAVPPVLIACWKLAVAGGALITSTFAAANPQAAESFGNLVEAGIDRIATAAGDLRNDLAIAQMGAMDRFRNSRLGKWLVRGSLIGQTLMPGATDITTPDETGMGQHQHQEPSAQGRRAPKKDEEQRPGGN